MTEEILKNDTAKISRVQPSTYALDFIKPKITLATDVQEFREIMQQLAEGPKGPGEKRKLIIDGSKLEFLSSAALNSIMIIDKKLRARGDHLMITNLKPEVYEVFQITRLSNYYDIRKTMEEALASTGRGERSV